MIQDGILYTSSRLVGTCVEDSDVFPCYVPSWYDYTHTWSACNQYIRTPY